MLVEFGICLFLVVGNCEIGCVINGGDVFE